MANLVRVNCLAPAIPDGKTVTPINDAELLQKCAGIANPEYDTIAGVIGDSSVLETVITSNNAMDYLVRSTDWTSAIASSQAAMTEIGNNNYASDTLISDTTWVVAIGNSLYMEKVLNVKVPPTSESGNLIYGTSDGQAWYGQTRPFSGSGSPAYTPSSAGKNGVSVWFGYNFREIVKIVGFKFKNDSNTNEFPAVMVAKNGKVQGSNNGTTWNDVASFSNPSNASNYTFLTFFPNVEGYSRWREYITETYSPGLNGTKTGINMQFYGRKDV